MRLLISLFLPAWLLAVPLESLIENATSEHTSLKSIEQRVAAIDDEYEASRNFEDPTIALNISDIQLNDIGNRALEPMQFTSLTFAQKIPYFGKRDATSDKIRATQEKLSLSLEAMKVKIVSELKVTAYTIWEKEEELKIIDEYIQLTLQNIELYSATTTTDSKSHMSIMSAEMSLSELKIKQSKLSSSLKGLYKKISYLSEEEVKSIEMDMTLFQPQALDVYIQTKANNVTYKIKEASIQVAELDTKIKELSASIDPVIQVGYYQREAYEDYINIGIAFKVPLYGTQDSMTEKSRKISLARESELADFNNLLYANITKVHAQLEDAYTVHKIIMQESMPQIKHMFELSSSSIKSGDELFIYIGLLEQKLALDEKNIAIVAQYHKNQAVLDSLIGEIK